MSEIQLTHTLLTVSTLASTKAINSLRSARAAKARNITSSKSKTMPDGALIAKPAAAPASSKTRSPASLQEMEFNLPGEDREWNLGFREPCPQCGGWANLHARYPKTMTPVYTVECSRDNCDNSTPEMPTSQLAIRHWQLVAKLAK
jgi:hypothetical protein